MQYIDVFELSRTRRSIDGELTLNDMPELGALLEGQSVSAHVRYQALGTAGHRDLPGADLTIEAVITTQCVRCGTPVEVRIEKTVPFLFVKSEKEADEMPIEKDDGFEIVVGSRRFALADWVQEEVILSLPAFPQHEDCEPDREKLQTEETPETLERPNPFAVLASLKTKK